MKHFARLSALILAICLGTAVAQQDGEGGTSPFDHLQLELVADGFVSPVTLTTPADDERLFLVDRPGQIYVLSQQGEGNEEPFLDLTDRVIELDPGYDERGLLGLAFHPDYAENGRLYVYYSAPLRDDAPEGWNHTAVLSEFTANEDGQTADPDSERILLEIHQPQMNHNGGQLAFGHDGNLLLGLGDGGGADDVGEGHPPLGNGQDVTTLLGSVLRLDVDAESGYGIPDDNPFADGADLPQDAEYQGDEARPEIYLWGVRNPYRFSVDRETGELIIPDVGQNIWEEVNVVDGPANLGWNLKEASRPFDPENPNEVYEPNGPEEGPMGEELVDPVLEYAHPNVEGEEGRGISISSGYMYRGQQIEDLTGHYVFGDWSQSFNEPAGKLFVADPNGDGEGVNEWEFVLDRQVDEFVLAFGEDAAGEIYMLTTENAGPQGTTGKVYRITGGQQSQ